MATWWVAAQDTRTGVKYVVVASGDSQFPSGDLPSISEVSGPYATQAAAQSAANAAAALPGALTGAVPKTGGTWWLINATSGNPGQYVITQSGSKPVPANSAFTVTGPYATKDAAIAAVPAGATYSIQTWNSILGTFGAIGKALKKALNTQVPTPSLSNPLSGLEAIGGFFNGLKAALTSANLWIRVAKVAIGGVLMIVGLAKLTGADKQVAVLGRAAAAAPLL